MTAVETTVPEHPATFSRAILDRLREMLAPERDRVGSIRVLDPFAGTGGVHELAEEKVVTYGVEIQPEWATSHPRTTIGSVLDLPAMFGEEAAFDAMVTSPCYGNRMADKHQAKDSCRACGGDGFVRDQRPPDFDRVTCGECGGAGLTRRNTYAHALRRSGVEIVHSEENAAIMQWGTLYRAFHEQAWQVVDRLLRPEGLVLLNVKNHVRAGRLQRVVEFHLNTFLWMGYTIEEVRRVETRGLAYGANYDVRTPVELILALRKESR